jgi:hypothetical protein
MPDRSTTITSGRDFAFDETRNILFSTSGGSITRWDAVTGRYLDPIPVPGTLAGGLTDIAISADGRYAVVGERDLLTTAEGRFGVLHRVDLQTGAVVDVRYAQGFYEQGVSNIAITADGRVLFTTDFAGSGWTPFRSFSLVDPGAGVSLVLGLPQVRQSSSLTTSPDGRTLVVAEYNISNAPLEVYDAATSQITARTDLYRNGQSGFNNDRVSVSNDGLIASVTYNTFFVYDRSLNVVQNFTDRQFPPSIADAEFSADGRQLYIWNATSDRIEVFDVATWKQIGVFDPGVLISPPPIGEPTGRLQLLDDGQLLALTTNSGLRIIDLTARMTTLQTGGEGADVLYGTVGADRIFGVGGNDMIRGGLGSDSLNGGDGNDNLSGEMGSDSLEGGSGSDTLWGGRGDDVVLGGDGNDWLSGDRGRDTIDGGAGTDVLIVNGSTAGRTAGGTTTAFRLSSPSSTNWDQVTGVERISLDSGATSMSLAEFQSLTFQPFRYLAGFADLRAAFGTDAAAARNHFEVHGRAEGRDYGAFDVYGYLASNLDLALAFGTDTERAALHYLQYGLAEGRRTDTFDAGRYLAAHADLQVAFGDDADAAVIHYLTYGAREGRATSSASPAATISEALKPVEPEALGHASTPAMLEAAEMTASAAMAQPVALPYSDLDFEPVSFQPWRTEMDAVMA